MTRYMPDGWVLPAVDELNEEYFGAARLVVQHCASCAAHQHPPEEICHRCRGSELGWREVAGRGTVYSFIVVHHAPSPALADRVPYAVVLVSLDEHPDVRIVGNVIDLPPAEVHIGLPVSVVFEEIDDPEGGTIHLPQWKALGR